MKSKKTIEHITTNTVIREAQTNPKLQYGKNSIYDQIMEHRSELSGSDFAMLAQGHQFLASIHEHLKYAVDLPTELQTTLGTIGEYFKFDRIIIIEMDMTNGASTVNFQWNSKPENYLPNSFTTMSEAEIETTSKSYDKYGCLEINPTHNIYSVSSLENRIIKGYALANLLANQLWIPTLKGGKYTGAICLDRYDTTPYTAAEKFLYSEFANNLTVYIDRFNAETANRAKSDFLSTMSHEIRTPMNAIVGMSEVALREEMSPSVRKCLKTVQSSAFGLLTLINDILDYSKIEAGKLEIVPETFHTLSMVNDMYEIAKARNNNKLTLSLHISEELPSQLYGDIVRIKQVMINFCTNAIKYTDEGSVDIFLNVEKLDDKHGEFYFSVKDTGIGIRKEDLKKLFKQYGQVDTTVNHHKEGTGLGLMISKQLIEAMNGHVSVDSEYGKGSTFSFHFTVEVPDWTPAGKLEDYEYEDEASTSDADLFTAPEAKILIVDDTPLNLVVANALLSPIGMNIDTANDGYEALNLISHNTYDLIMMDHFMPGMDGVETTKKIRGMTDNPNHEIPIIALTADVMAGSKEELLSNGMTDFLAKPILIKLAYQTLRRWLPEDKICPV